MKKLKTSFVAVVIVVFSSTVMATGNLKLSIIPGESEKAVVNVTNASQSHFEIEVKNELGDVIFYKETKTPLTNYIKVFDFSMLNDGHYTFTVKLDKEMETNTLDVSHGKVKVVAERKDVHPFFIFQDNEFRLSYLNYAKDKIKFYLYDNSTNELVMERDLKSDFAITYGLDFSKIESGSYDAILAGTNNTYEYEIAID